VAAELENIVNVTELVENATAQINDVREDLANLNVDLTNIKYVFDSHGTLFILI